MADESIYREADRQLEVLSRYMSKEFQNLSVKVGFDELNVVDVKREVNDMYARIDKQVRKRYRKIVKKVYGIGATRAGKKIPPLAVASFVAAYLRGYDETTQYVYTHEWTRKRDRQTEAIMSCEGHNDMRKAIKRGLDVTYGQVRQYADDMTVAALLAAYIASDVPYVRWVTQQDDRVCEMCGPRDGKVYRIDRLPPFPAHWKCRCEIWPQYNRMIF